MSVLLHTDRAVGSFLLWLSRSLPMMDCLHTISPNVSELLAMSTAIAKRNGLTLEPPEFPPKLVNPVHAHEIEGTNCADFEWIESFAAHLNAVLSCGVQQVLLTFGEHGACLCRMDGKSIHVIYLPAIASSVQSCGGAGKYSAKGPFVCTQTC